MAIRVRSVETGIGRRCAARSFCACLHALFARMVCAGTISRSHRCRYLHNCKWWGLKSCAAMPCVSCYISVSCYINLNTFELPIKWSAAHIFCARVPAWLFCGHGVRSDYSRSRIGADFFIFADGWVCKKLCSDPVSIILHFRLTNMTR